MHIHRLSPDEALLSLRSRDTGLSEAEAAERAHEYGPNAVRRVERRSWVWALLGQFTHFFALILWCAAALALFAETQQPGEGMATLAAAIVGVIVINGVFSFWQEFKAERALAALQQLLPNRVRVRRGGEVGEREAECLVPGDVILLKEGDRVPADARLLESFGLRVDESTLTGESAPRRRSSEADASESAKAAHNLVFAGTTIVTGEARALVFAIGERSEFGRIAALTQSTSASVSPLALEIQRLSRILVTIACALGLLFFALGWWLGLSWWSALIFAIGIIVANVPEGLLPTLTLSLAMAAQRMAKRRALIRHLPAVETLGCTTVVCTDKTGTLTCNRMEVRALEFDGQARGVDEFVGLPSDAGHTKLLETLGLCHGLARGQAGWLGDPMEIALVEFAERALGRKLEHARLGEVPFDSSRKRMSVAHALPEGPCLLSKGAVETLLPRCTRRWASGQIVELDADARARLHAAADALADRGLRVLLVAWRPLAHELAQARALEPECEAELIVVGLVGLEDPPRPEVPAAIARCRAAGIRVLMVTGDGPHTAAAIGREIGLVDASARVIAGDELERLTATQLQLALDHEQLIFARVSPEQKMRIVVALQAKQHVVAVTGDGVNDAPALKRADIGIAMGKSGTDVAREAADIVLLDDDFGSIVAAIEEGRAIFDNLRKFLTYILASNVPELVPYLLYVLLGIPLPLTIIQILAVDLGTDMLPALALGAERPDPEVMRSPPRKRSERLLSAKLLARAYGFLGVLEAIASLAAFFFVLEGLGWSWGVVYPSTDLGYRAATTACLTTIVVTQIANVFACRSELRSAFRTRVLDNPLLIGAIAAELVLIVAIDYSPFGQRVFQTAPIGAEVWGLAAAMALGLLVLEELRKWIARRLGGGGRVVARG